MDLEFAKQTFIQEALELLGGMESALLVVEEEEDRTEAVNAIFRAVHTIKGSAGLFGFEIIVRFAHTLETALDRIRNGQAALSHASITHLLACHDHLAVLVEEISRDFENAPDLEIRGRALLDGLAPLLEAPRLESAAGGNHSLVSAQAGHGLEASPEAGSAECWHLSVRFGPTVFQDGFDPLSCLRYLGTLGTITHVYSLFAFPPDETFDPEICHLGFEIELATRANRKTLEDVFEFVRQDAAIRIIPPNSRIQEYIALIQEAGDASDLLGGILVACGCISRESLDEALRLQSEEGNVPPGPRRIGEILVEEQAVPPALVVAALEKQKRGQDPQSSETKVVRVQADRLDRLVDLVGELVIAGASAQAQAGLSKEAGLIESTAIINKLVEEIRDNALSLRMVQIGETFSRFRRIVRDVSKELGKSIELEIRGGETELDKSMVEKLSDPLMHIVRNAIDHGIEPLDVRRARGKADSGSLALSASHETGSIVIEVSDDGGGLNRNRILAKALERGLVRENAVLSDQEVWQLIFAPGFSTADAVTDISGRGVGMDVVRRNIDDLRGTIDIDSYEGSGTIFRIRLPLTLAIIDGFRVGVGNTSYVIPLNLVQECVDLNAFLESAENHLVNLRGEVLPFLRLREVFGIGGDLPPREQVVVIQYGEIRAGIVVDRLQGEFQTVIKPLGELFRQTRGIGGSTILGSGEVALILDIPQLVQRVSSAGHRPAPSASI